MGVWPPALTASATRRAPQPFGNQTIEKKLPEREGGVAEKSIELLTRKSADASNRQ